MKRLVVLLGLGILGGSGCDPVYGDLGHNDPKLAPCTGECVTVPSLGWEGPVLLWTGPPESAEECPERAPNVVYEGHDGLSTVPQCPTCSCSPSACVLPGLIADSGNMCAGDELTYPPPDGWNGSCVSSGVVTDTTFDSIQFPPLSEAPCEPQTGDVTAQTRVEWATLARACQAADPIINTTCPGTTVCVPTSEPPPPGFSQCLFHEGEELDCPPGYPDRKVVFRDFDASAVGCTECTCGPPEGGACSATVRAFSDAMCSVTVGAAMVGTSGEPCSGNLMPGVNLAGMDALWISNQPGSCTPSGGEPFGEAVETDPATFCCQVSR